MHASWQTVWRLQLTGMRRCAVVEVSRARRGKAERPPGFRMIDFGQRRASSFFCSHEQSARVIRASSGRPGVCSPAQRYPAALPVQQPMAGHLCGVTGRDRPHPCTAGGRALRSRLFYPSHVPPLGTLLPTPSHLNARRMYLSEIQCSQI